MTRQEFKTRDVLQLDVGAPPPPNLIVNPEFGGSSGWAVVNGTLTGPGTAGGPGQYRSTASGLGPYQYVVWSSLVDVTPNGRTFTAAVDLTAVSTSLTMYVAIQWQDAAGAGIGEAGQTKTIASGSTVHYSVQGVAPVGAVKVRLVIANGSGSIASGAGFDVGNPSLRDSPTERAYSDRVNLIKNPHGERGAWGWITPPQDVAVSASTLDGPAYDLVTGIPSGPVVLTFTATAPSGVISYFTSEPAPCSAGEAVLGSGRIQYLMPAGRAGEISLVFYDSTGAQIARSGVTAIPSGAVVGSTYTATATAPANTARVALRFDALAGTNGARTFKVDRCSLVVGATAAEVATYAFTEPYDYTSVLLPTHEITVDRAALTLGTLQAAMRSATLDPAVNRVLRAGNQIRLRAESANDDGTASGARRNLYAGEILKATTSYDLTHRDPEKRAVVQITAVDPAARLANRRQPVGVATISDLRYLVEGGSTPWCVNGARGLVPGTPGVASRNENASMLDQIALARDTRLGHAWVDHDGILHAWDASTLNASALGATRATLTEADYRHDIEIDFDTSRCINEVTVKSLTLDGAGETVETVYGPYRDEASIAKWGQFREEFTVTGMTASSVASFAASILAANATPKVRVNSLNLPITKVSHLRAGPTAERRAHLDIGDRVRVKNTRAGIDEVMRVATVKHSIQGKKWIVTLGFAASSGVAMPAAAPELAARPIYGDTEWAYVGASGAPAFQGGWINYGGAFAPVRYRRKDGIVHLQGLAANGAMGAIMFTLPAGFRPAGGTLLFPTMGGNSFSRTDIDVGGNVIANTGASTAFWSLSGIQFPAEQ